MELLIGVRIGFIWKARHDTQRRRGYGRESQSKSALSKGPSEIPRLSFPTHLKLIPLVLAQLCNLRNANAIYVSEWLVQGENGDLQKKNHLKKREQERKRGRDGGTEGDLHNYKHKSISMLWNKAGCPYFSLIVSCLQGFFFILWIYNCFTYWYLWACPFFLFCLSTPFLTEIVITDTSLLSGIVAKRGARLSNHILFT